MHHGHDPEGVPTVSVVVCTYDRPECLRSCLRSVLTAVAEHPSVELVVVDNGPTRSARQVLDELAATNAVGLSHARNRGAHIARGQYVTFIDDDAMLPAGFMNRLLHTLQQQRPDILGGPVSPYYTTVQPRWFGDDLERRQHADVSGWSRVCGVSGSNFTIRRDMLLELGGFDPNLGMRGTTQGLGGERALLQAYRSRVSVEQQRVYYDLDCVVLHWVPPQKMRLRYQLARRFRGGRMHQALGLQTARATRGGTASLVKETMPYLRHLVDQYGVSWVGMVRLMLAVAFRVGWFVERRHRARTPSA
jgi:glucosyl-dolichyl phosphate glucuronosyltransferase